jgi:(S)-mandelate dehydrogenase
VSQDVARASNISHLRDIARARVPGFVFEYVEGGAEDEVTLQHNRESLDALRLAPQIPANTTSRHLRIELLGRTVAAPIVIAPTGVNGMLNSGGDVSLARAASRFSVPYTLSTMSTTCLEEVALQAGGCLWMQLYVMRNRAIAEDIMLRARDAGYEVLVFTTDANVFGNREWDKRNYRQPGKLRPAALWDAMCHPSWMTSVLLRNGIPRLRNIERHLPGQFTNAIGGSTVVPRLFEPTLTWNDIAWIRQHWPRKLVIKGVMSVADARKAAALGCEGIVLTNHGGRQLDSCASPLDLLPEVAAAVGERLSIIVDGGFRGGADIVKALALGAKAVMIGRATLYGLCAGGEAGVRRALEILTSELDRTMEQLGVNSVTQIGPHLLHRGRHVGLLPR